MTGGLFQLVVYGVENLILTYNPKITYFKSIFKRYTNFSIENIELNFTGNIDFGKQISCTIPKKGDLINKMYIKLILPKIKFDKNNEYIYSWVKYIGLAAIKSVELNIGGKVIDKHINDWLYIWNELTVSKSKKKGFYKMIGHIPDNYDFNLHFKVDIAEYICYIPLSFWFCKDISLSLPICALKTYDIKINLDLNILENCLLQANIVNLNDKEQEIKYQSSISKVLYLDNLDKLKCNLLIDYIFLDKNEKELFEKNTHIYCIEQLQYINTNKFMGDFSSIELNFNHPVKELFWCFSYIKNIDINEHFCYENYEKSNYYVIQKNNLTYEINTINFYQNNLNSTNPISTFNLYINGEQRFSEQSGDYSSILQPFYYHINTPNNGINIYSFSLYPENIQPSGSFNCSKIDEIIIENKLKTFYYFDNENNSNEIFENNKIIESGNGIIKIFALNYNIFKIKDGIGGFVYNN